MGIPTYFSHIVRKNRDIIKRIPQFNKSSLLTTALKKDNVSINHKLNTMDNMYLDCNSIIYEAVHEGNGQFTNRDKYEKDIIRRVCKKIEFYIDLIKPTQRILISFDGVAPYAKIKQQRNRRYLNMINEKLVNELCVPIVDVGQKWNTSAITPGTPFMNMLSKDIKNYFGVEKHSLYKKKEIQINVSTPNEPGEGEHKIYEYIRNNSEYHKNTTTIIYGLDADLIMLTLNHLHISNRLYLFRETPHFIQTIDNSLDPNSLYLIDIPLFSESIMKEMINNNNKSNILLDNNKLFDYIFICFLLGNDFMPHFPALNIRTRAIDKLTGVYKNIFNNNQSIISVNKEGHQQIVWSNLRKFIELLAINEHDWIKEEYKKRNKLSGSNKLYGNNQKHRDPQNLENEDEKRKNIEQEILNLPIKDRSCEKFINPFQGNWEQRYYSALFNININDEMRKKICINYIEGLEWTMKYYSTDCINWRWAYNYNYPPLLTDLIKYIPHYNTEILDIKPRSPLSMKEQLDYVLPEDIKGDLMKEYGHSDAYLSSSLTTNNINIKWAFCRYLWEGHIII
jgi:5'-3' exoribonuclease 1